MIKKILIGFALTIVIVLLILWLITGGPRKIINAARGMTNSLGLVFWSGTSTDSQTGVGQFRLPWQPEELLFDPSTIKMGDSDAETEAEEPQTPEEELSSTQKEYDELMKKIEDAKTFGEPSPYREQVQLAQGGASSGTVGGEYIEIEAAYDNTAPINIAGWSLQSALTGIRAHIPRGTNLFVMGSVNPQQDIYLNAGSVSVVSSASSPVGTSFRENICTGYLGGLQTFTPPLSRNCPSPGEALPLTPENLRTYGDACFDFVQTFSSCTFPMDVPNNVSPACHIFLSNNLSYNGCVQQYRYKNHFTRDAWRMYLNAGGELWRNSHDIIRLLDAEGKTVDVISY